MGLRVLIGVGAWILGATAATGGGFVAVDRMSQDLLSQHSKQISISTVNADLAREHSESAAPTPRPTPTQTRPAQKLHHRKPARSAPSPTGVLLVSRGGSVEAVCQAGGAYLVYWSPQQGYEADSVIRGPAAVAQVAFRANLSGVLMRVTCSAGHPVKHLSDLRWRDE